MNDLLNQVGEFINSFYGLPKIAILSLFALTVGYVLRLQEWFDNRRIPLIVVGLCMLGAPVLEIGAYQPNLIPQVLIHIMVGAVIGFATWQIHHRILAKIERKIPFLGNLLSDMDEPDENQDPAGNSKPPPVDHSLHQP